MPFACDRHEIFEYPEIHAVSIYLATAGVNRRRDLAAPASLALRCCARAFPALIARYTDRR
jgi:hypothetical protein